MFSVFHRNKKKAVSGERQARSAGGAELAQAALATKPELIPELKRDVAAATGADPALSWQTLLRRLREYREQGEGGLLLLRLQIAAVEQYTEHYAAELPAYLEAVGSNDPILLICNRQLQAGNPREARRFAEPYLQYLDSSPALFRDGHLELGGQSAGPSMRASGESRRRAGCVRRASSTLCCWIRASCEPFPCRSPQCMRSRPPRRSAGCWRPFN